MGSRRRTLAVVVTVAVASMAAGFVAAQRITSPAESAARARAPEAGPITAPVERRHLKTELVTRGDVQFDGAVDVQLAVGGQGPAVATGRVPAVGDQLPEGAVLLEITGRPVIVLGGELPTYRSFAYGVEGPDVKQLEEALARLGLDVGEVDGLYDRKTAEAVTALYDRAGYEPPAIPPDAAAAREQAERQVEAATTAVEEAEQRLADAQAPPSDLDRLRADADVVAAQQRLADEQRATPKHPVDPLQVSIAQAELAATEQRRNELLAPDTTEQQNALAEAQARLAEANTALWEAAEKAVTPLPEHEIVFISKLPRRVDAVSVGRGDVVESNGKVMTVSGATMVIKATVNANDAELLKKDMAVMLEADGQRIPATIGGLSEPASSGNGQSTVTVTIVPKGLKPAQQDALRGANVKVTIPIANTEGKVLAVPVAALTAGADGGARVEVLREDGTTERIAVEVGLTAGGYAEIDPREADLGPGDAVVVGR